MAETVPVEVTVVRDSKDSELYVISVIETFWGAWIIMVLIPVFAPVHLSYWQSLAAVFVSSILFNNASYIKWSRRKR